jgi:hypothetical protein
MTFWVSSLTDPYLGYAVLLGSHPPVAVVVVTFPVESVLVVVVVHVHFQVTVKTVAGPVTCAVSEVD